MKNIILILLTAIALTGCFPEYEAGCPANMYLKFTLVDEYEEGTFDTRIGNDVTLYLYRGKQLISAQTIPYDQISGGKTYAITKNADIQGELDVVAWAVPAGDDPVKIPAYVIGNILDDNYLSLSPYTRADDCNPGDNDLYLGRITSTETVDLETVHEVGMIHGLCRVEVNVTDLSGAFSGAQSSPRIILSGVMSRMDMSLNGCGSQATVYTILACPLNDEITYTTGRFSVAPSADDQMVGVRIYDGDRFITALDIPRSAAPQGAKAGGLIIFDYTLGQPEFVVNINGYRHIIVIDDM